MIDTLTVAYIAKGMHEVLRSYPGYVLTPVIEHFVGELNMVQFAIEAEDVLSKVFDMNRDNVDFVFDYDVSEPFGMRIVHEMIRNQFITPLQRDAIAAQMAFAEFNTPRYTNG